MIIRFRLIVIVSNGSKFNILTISAMIILGVIFDKSIKFHEKF